MAHPHGGRGNQFLTRHTFAQAFGLVGNRSYTFYSTTNEKITAKQSFAKDGVTAILTFTGEHSRHGGACEACWGFPFDCSGSRIGHCVKALDDEDFQSTDSVVAHHKPADLPARPATSRADREKEFRDIVRRMESVIREHMPWGHAAPDRRTLGYLIHECKDVKLLEGPELGEALFVNAVRNSLYHPGTGDVSDEQLTRAVQAAEELVAHLASL